jgi:hypothetical protein
MRLKFAMALIVTWQAVFALQVQAQPKSGEIIHVLDGVKARIFAAVFFRP